MEKDQKSHGKWRVILPLLVVLVVWVVSLPANLNFAEGRYHLFMDEREVIYDEVNAILSTESVGELLYATTAGDNRYGQWTWNSAALVSFLPRKIWGEGGQIIATRLLYATAVIAGIFGLSLLFQNAVIRVMFCLVAATLPFTSYYMTQPKPEPWCLLALLGVFASIRFRHKLGSAFFPVLGLCLGFGCGMKISFFPFFIVLVSFGVFQWVYNRKFSSVTVEAPSTRMLVLAVLSFLLGFCFAEPFLISHFNFKQYLRDTWLNTGHPMDQESNSFFTWVDYMSGWYLNSLPKGGYLVVIFVFSLLTIVLVRTIKQLREKSSLPIVEIVVSSALVTFLFPIVLTVKRVEGWGFYLWLASIVCVFLFFVLYERLLKKTEGTKLNWRVWVPLFVVLLLMIPFQARGFFEFVELASKRSEDVGHRQRSERYHNVLDYLSTKEEYLKTGKNIYWDPSEYYPLQLYGNTVTPFWGGLHLSNTPNADFIVYKTGKVIQKKKFFAEDENPTDQQVREAWENSIMDFSKTVVGEDMVVLERKETPDS